MKERSKMLTKILAGHFTEMPTDRELGSDLATDAPKALTQALKSAHGRLTALQAEASALPGDIKAANHAGATEKLTALRERENALRVELRDAKLAVLDAEKAIHEAELAPLLAENTATMDAIAELESIVSALEVAKRRRTLISNQIANKRTVLNTITRNTEFLSTMGGRSAQPTPFHVQTGTQTLTYL